ncbi:hypothetical protein HZS_7157 [Henneguya salminicola]|nr:hypothetical protein HZS_7157 [Henneguya salminicola]
MAVRIRNGNRNYLRAYPLYIFDMVDRLLKKSGYNKLKPEYTSISCPREVELNDLSPNEKNLVINMFRLAHKTLQFFQNSKFFKNILTANLIMIEINQWYCIL